MTRSTCWCHRNNPSSNNPAEYDDYASARGGYDDAVNNPGGLALEESALLAINDPGKLIGAQLWTASTTWA